MADGGVDGVAAIPEGIVLAAFPIARGQRGYAFAPKFDRAAVAKAEFFQVGVHGVDAHAVTKVVKISIRGYDYGTIQVDHAVAAVLPIAVDEVVALELEVAFVFDGGLGIGYAFVERGDGEEGLDGRGWRIATEGEAIE